MHADRTLGRIKVFFFVTSVVTSMAAIGAARDWEASCPPLPNDSVQAQLSAGKLFDEAEKHYRSGRPVEALQRFLCSFRIVQHENTVFNIAQIAKLSQNREVYLGLLKDFVANTNGSVKVDPIREIIADLDPSYTFDTTDADNENSGPSEERIAAPLESIPAEPQSPPAEFSIDKKQRGMKLAGWAVFGVGAASAVVGGVFQGLASAAQKDATTQDTLTDFTTAESKMNHMQVGAIAGFAAGGALIATGLVLVLVSQKGGESKQVSVIPSLGGLSVAGRF